MKEFDALGVRAFLHSGAADALDGVALTHGAGSHCDSALLRSVAEALSEYIGSQANVARGEARAGVRLTGPVHRLGGGRERLDSRSRSQ